MDMVENEEYPYLILLPSGSGVVFFSEDPASHVIPSLGHIDTDDTCMYRYTCTIAHVGIQCLHLF